MKAWIIALLFYFGVGISLLLTGLFRQAIGKAVDEVRGNPLSRAITGRHMASPIRVLLFRIMLAIGTLTLWPFFLPGMLKERNIPAKVSHREQGLYFDQMGGAGIIKCQTCNYAHDIVSFIHGFPIDSWNKAGFQCQACGNFHEIENFLTNKNRECDCGGELSRGNKLFCPKCKSKNLSYQMEFIT